MTDRTSATLLLRLQQPESKEAWNHFVELYTPLLYYWATRSGLQSQDAAELVQEVFLVLLKKLPNFEYDRKKSFRAWLYTVLRSKWADLLRKRNRQPANDQGLSSVTDESELADLEETEFRQVLIKRALQLVAKEFSPTTVAAFRGTALEGRAAAEVAAELQISENAVYLARRRVMQRLREDLEGMCD